MIRIGATFEHRGVTWKIRRTTPEWAYCLPVNGKLSKSVANHLEPDGTFEWCRESVQARLKGP